MEILVSNVEIKHPMEIKFKRPVYLICISIYFLFLLLTLVFKIDIPVWLYGIDEFLIVLFILLGI